MEGYLNKWTNYILRWRRRYFILKNNILFYFINKGDKAKGRIHLGICSINVTDDIKFELDTGMGKIFLKAESESELNDWVREIKRAKDNLNSLQNYSYERTNTEINNFIPKEINIEEEKFNRKLSDLSTSIVNLSNVHKELQILNDKKNEFPFEKLKKITDDIIIKDENVKINLCAVKLSFEDLWKEIAKIAEKLFTNNIINHSTGENRRNLNEVIIYGSTDKNENINNFYNSTGHLKDNNVDVIKEKSEIFYAVDELAFSSQKSGLDSIKLKYKQNEERPIQIIDNIFVDKCYMNKRTHLPMLKSKNGFRIWDILKNAIGKDLSKFSVPVYFNEPISMLQRLCENFQYAGLLNKAAIETNSLKRLAYLAAFCIGGYSTNIHRTLKPFNPLLGETFEYIDLDLKFRFLAEQVSHHPPISACYAEGENYVYYTNSNAKTKINILKGSIEVHSVGRSFLIFKKFNNEMISFTKPKVGVKNLIVGKLHLECFDSVNVTNHSNGESCVMSFPQDGFFSKKEKGIVEGYVKDSNNEVKMKIEGSIFSKIEIIYQENDCEKRECIYENIRGDNEQTYFFTDFTINLNNLTEEMKNLIAPSDSRLRPDQSALESGDFEKASFEKDRLENKQRVARKENEKKKIDYRPAYFEESYDEINGEVIYKYNRDYWLDRKNNNFSQLPSIY